MNVNKNNVAAATLKTDGVFEQIGQMIKDNPDEAKKVNAVFAYKITNDGKIVSEWSKYFNTYFENYRVQRRLEERFNFACLL